MLYSCMAAMTPAEAGRLICLHYRTIMNHFRCRRKSHRCTEMHHWPHYVLGNWGSRQVFSWHWLHWQRRLFRMIWRGHRLLLCELLRWFFGRWWFFPGGGGRGMGLTILRHSWNRIVWGSMHIRTRTFLGWLRRCRNRQLGFRIPHRFRYRIWLVRYHCYHRSIHISHCIRDIVWVLWLARVNYLPNMVFGLIWLCRHIWVIFEWWWGRGLGMWEGGTFFLMSENILYFFFSVKLFYLMNV
jgi:hypothetical protein